MKDKVHLLSNTGLPDIPINQQWETDENVLDLPVGLDDLATSTTIPTLKPKRTQKNTTLVSFPSL
jgi:hypothetical protein